MQDENIPTKRLFPRASTSELGCAWKRSELSHVFCRVAWRKWKMMISKLSGSSLSKWFHFLISFLKQRVDVPAHTSLYPISTRLYYVSQCFFNSRTINLGVYWAWANLFDNGLCAWCSITGSCRSCSRCLSSLLFGRLGSCCWDFTRQEIWLFTLLNAI